MDINIDINISITSSKIYAFLIATAGIVYGFINTDPAVIEILVTVGSGIYMHKNYTQNKEKLNGGKKC